MQIAESPVVAKIAGTSVGGTGPDLTGYPHLVYAPSQWGEGVRCQSHGQPVEPIGRVMLRHPIGVAAFDFRCSLHEALDAFRYCEANGLI
jgi:hypothetical protein